jgi:2-polyprenyl-6-hydroxyphenyl methylase / 3-demethylubiquinone-9 3-methyltransferase
MINTKSTIDKQEVNKFSQHAAYWWDTSGPLKTLHDINATRLDFIAQYSPFNNTTVLDVGCGGGILSEGMAQLGAKVIGIDASEEAVQVARQHALKNNLNIDYEHLPIEDYEHLGFDVITCMEMLEHVHNPELVLEHCKRLLKPGGLLFLSTISRTVKAYASAIIAAEYILGIVPKQTHEYSKFIKPSELANRARNLGLSVLDMNGLRYNPFTRVASLDNDVSVNYLLVLKQDM